MRRIWTALGLGLWTIAVSCAWAQDVGDILKLNESLPQAVCDRGTASRAPSLESLNSGDSKLFWVELGETERSALELIFKGGREGLGAPKAAEAKTVAIEICTSLVTPGKLRALLERERSWFHPATPLKSSAKPVTPRAGKILVKAMDWDSRYGQLEKSWLAPGWVALSEVLEIWAGDRTYLKLERPVTHQFQHLIAVSKSRKSNAWLPQALIHPIQSSAFHRKTGEEEQAVLFQTRIEIYRGLIASNAATHPPSPKLIQLQEAYQKKLMEYRDTAQDPKWKNQAKSPLSAPRVVIPAALFKEMGLEATDLGADSVLQALWEEYLSKSESLKTSSQN